VSLLALAVLVKLHSCKKLTDDWQTFTIRKGEHRSTNNLNFSKRKIFNWDVQFDSSAVYQTVDTLNQLDINKLIGWSDCGEDHIRSSIRFGWRWTDSLEIHWFKHEDGNFTFNKITSISLNETHRFHLQIHETEYELHVDEFQIFIQRKCRKFKRKYKLYPYFGGNETAPHDIEIKIKEI